jgi:hypothetical protein
VHVASLEGGLRENLADRRAKPCMIVGHHQFDAVQASLSKGEKEVSPGGTALAVGHLDGEDLATPVPVDADRDQHGLAHDDARLAHLLIARVEDEIRKGLAAGALGKGLEALV